MVRFAVVFFMAAVLCAFGAAKGLFTLAASDKPSQPTVAVANSTDVSAQSPVSSPGDAAIAKSPDGQFWADAQVNGQPIHFLVDPGATDVSLTTSDAFRLGYAPGSLDYRYSVTTANGTARAARIKLGVVAVGRAQALQVNALVIDNLPTSVLGMSYLSRLSRFEFTPDSLVLHS